MRALLLVLFLVGIFPACTPIHNPTATATVEVLAQRTIDDANILIASTANVIAQNVKEGVMTKEEGLAVLDRLRVMARQVDEAGALMREGKHLLAQNRAEIAHRLILSLHREVAAKARKQ